MIRINQIKMELHHTEEDLVQKVLNILKISKKDMKGFLIAKKSIDARKKPYIFLTYSVDVEAADESKLVKKLKNPQVVLQTGTQYQFPKGGTRPLKERPVIVGSGPAGLFCAYFLAENGYSPILLERGADVEERTGDVEAFWNTGVLNTASNVQFGEGGAGTFSDGKLNTLVKDKDGRNKEVLRIFVKFGAGEEILYENKPHIGTDILVSVVKNMREAIIAMGGEVRFHAQVTDFFIEDERITGVEINGKERLCCQLLVLAIGHSARDTFACLNQKKIPMEAKSFAVGLRVEHPQEIINFSQYGMECSDNLPPAVYKVTAQTKSERGVYSFCMCPGGYVVNASSEDKRLAVNGMSYHKRNGKNANSAVIVSVSPKDFKDSSPLGGIAFQRKLEERAYQIGNGSVPVQLWKDFKENKKSQKKDLVYEPAIKGAYTLANVREIMPEALNLAFMEGMETFGKMIKGFDDNTVLLSGIESRTSSPVRIHRDETLQSSIKGLYPCGEGAGYAGGITSAAMDGIRVAEQIAKEFSCKSD